MSKWVLAVVVAACGLPYAVSAQVSQPGDAGKMEYSLCEMDFRPIAMHDHLPAAAVYIDPKADAEARAGDVVKRLTFEEKLALTGGVKTFYFPGVERLGIPPVYFADATQGLHEKDICIKVLKTTAFPSGQTLAATWNRQLAYDFARALSEECRAWGVSVLLGPGLNLYRNSEGGRNFEYFGEDPYLASQIGVGYVKGMQSLGTIATAKHFIGNEQEFIRHDSDVQIGERALREIYLPPFKAVIEDAGAMAVMTGNNFVNGYPGAGDTPLTAGVLRKEYGFKGVIMSDWANSMYWLDRQSVELTSGHSLLMQDNSIFANWVQNEFAAHPEKKAEIEVDLGKMAQANLYSFFKAGVYDRPYRDTALVNTIESHNATALKTAEEGITLLKNEGGILPIDPVRVGKIAVVGTDEALSVYGGKGSGAVKGYDHIDMMAGLKATYGDKVMRAADGDDAFVRSADVVLYFINKRGSESADFPFEIEGLAKSVERLAALNDHVVVIFSGGNGFAMPWLPKVKGLVFAFLLGQQRGTALAEVLSGKVNPSGKLPFSIEKSFADSPAYDYNKLPDGTYGWGGGRGDSMKAQKKFGMLPLKYNEGVYIGYRWYEKKKIETQFPFGFGMSYTTFAYSAVKSSASRLTASAPVTVEVTIRNTGTRDGAEVAQMYVHAIGAGVDRPIKELKGFEKVALKAGESKKVSLRLQAKDLAYWDTVSHNWKIDAGTYEVLIGASSADIRGKVIVRY